MERDGRLCPAATPMDSVNACLSRLMDSPLYMPAPMPGNQPVPLACFAHQRGDSPANIEHQRLDIFYLGLWMGIAVFVVIVDKGERDKFDVWQVATS